MSFTTLLVTISFAQLSLTRALVEEFRMTSESEIALEGFVYSHSTALDLWDCFKKCYVERLCQSINFNLDSTVCEFNKDIKRLNPLKSRPRYQGVYMENPKRGLSTLYLFISQDL
jgi:hypothetical protein